MQEVRHHEDGVAARVNDMNILAQLKGQRKEEGHKERTGIGGGHNGMDSIGAVMQAAMRIAMGIAIGIAIRIATSIAANLHL